MSSQSASYQISAAERARLAEVAAVAEATRQWQGERTRRQELRVRAQRIASRYQCTVPTVERVGEPAGTTSRAILDSLDLVRQQTRITEAAVAEAERNGQEKVVGAIVAKILATPPSAPTARPAQRPAEDTWLRRDLAEAAAVRARLEPAIDPPDELDQFLETIARADVDGRSALLDDLRRAVSTLNEPVRRRLHEEAEIAYLKDVVAETSDPALAALLDAAEHELAAGRPVDTGRLREAAQATLRRRQAERERRFAEQAAIAAWEELGYEVVAGFEVSTPTRGVLMRRVAGSPDAVSLEVSADTVAAAPVRLVTDATAGSDRDTDSATERAAEQVICADAARAWQRLTRRHIDLTSRVTSVSGLTRRVVEVPAAELATSASLASAPPAREVKPR